MIKMKETCFLWSKFWDIYFPRPVHRRWLSPFWLCSANIDLFTCYLKCDACLTFPFCSGFYYKLKHNSFPFFLKCSVLDLTVDLALQILGSVSIWFAPVSWTLLIAFFFLRRHHKIHYRIFDNMTFVDYRGFYYFQRYIT